MLLSKRFTPLCNLYAFGQRLSANPSETVDLQNGEQRPGRVSMWRGSRLGRMNGGLGCVLLAALAGTMAARAQRIITSQYDNARTGANLGETTLTPRNVNAQQFGKIFALKVDGDVYAQPLFLGGVEIPGKGRHDVLFIATEHDSVYAFDAYGKPSSPLWHVSFLKDGVTTVPARAVDCPFIYPEVGITSTPVIDPDTGTLYVLARTKEGRGLMSSVYPHKLHALAVTTGVEKFGGPADIEASVNGKGSGSLGQGKVPFNRPTENPRASLLLANGTVYMTWGSSCDVGPYHGWAMAYDAQTLKQKAVFNASPDADDERVLGERYRAGGGWAGQRDRRRGQRTFRCGCGRARLW